eukprot:CAMPEP_0173110930 /NCGR_PEP_ID=MMETSP1102-20130122/44766_1 /TAXON_ID=49646 /ORGANISM="Geminigera sp., Strain Caron Lab Isolate" /LENGTH=56 /DNA_ID=CAMNT_0014011005 /DNA_START=215 /DNA_END=385 /DNA_ORIENTATION=-
MVWLSQRAAAHDHVRGGHGLQAAPASTTAPMQVHCSLVSHNRVVDGETEEGDWADR